MDPDIQAKKGELLKVLYEIEQKMLNLDSKGLSVAVFDYDKSNSLLSDIKKECEADSTRLEVELQGKNDQSTKDQNLKNGFDKYMKDENKKLSGYKENVNIYMNISKKYISEINVKKLKPLASKQNVGDLFRYLFSLLYDKPESEYNQQKFVKLALGDDADDFQIKLANFNTSKFHSNPETADQFKRIKDKQFPESETNQDLNNLLNWMDYIYEMYLAELEFKQQQQNLKMNQNEFSDRLTRISQEENDSVRKRDAYNIYQKAIERVNQNKNLLEQKQRIVGQVRTDIKVDKREFIDNLQKFKKELYEMPNHL